MAQINTINMNFNLLHSYLWIRNVHEQELYSINKYPIVPCISLN